MLLTIVSSGSVAFQQRPVASKKVTVLHVATQFDSSPPWLNLRGSPASSSKSRASEKTAASYQTKPSWLTEEADRHWARSKDDGSRTLALLDSRPHWLSSNNVPSKQPSAAKRPQATFDSQPLWIEGGAKQARLANAYDAAALIWLGALVDGTRSSPMVAASFGAASAAARILSIAASSGRLSSATYTRLSGCLAVFGLGQAALAASAKPATAVAHVVAASAAAAGCAASGTFFLREAASVLAGLLPSIKSAAANAYLALVLVPSLCVVISAPPATALGAWLFAGIGVSLKDAAARNRLNASTFRRLNIVLGLAVLVAVKHIPAALPRQAPFLVAVSSAAACLTLGNGLGAVWSAKRI